MEAGSRVEEEERVEEEAKAGAETGKEEEERVVTVAGAKATAATGVKAATKEGRHKCKPQSWTTAMPRCCRQAHRRDST
jgi:hypothetical protein